MSFDAPLPKAPSIWRPARAWFKPKPLRVAWVFVCSFLLLQLWTNPLGYNAEGQLIWLIVLAMITSPVGWLSGTILSMVDFFLIERLGLPSLLMELRIIPETALAAAIGYWQWFVFFPYLWKRLKEDFLVALPPNK